MESQPLVYPVLNDYPAPGEVPAGISPFLIGNDRQTMSRTFEVILGNSKAFEMAEQKPYGVAIIPLVR